MTSKALVLDANILIRTVLGKRVWELLIAPDVAYADAKKYLPAVLKKRGIDSTVAITVLDNLDPYGGLQAQALQRTTVKLHISRAISDGTAREKLNARH